MTDTAAVTIGVPTEVLVAPDSFKGTFTSAQAAHAIGSGLEAAGMPVQLCPVADGGEGTLEVLLDALGGELREARVSDPLGRPVKARFGLAQTRRGGATAVIESAAASGLGLVSASERDPIAASTAGTGELILAAVRSGAREVLLGVGGSATTDGGAGAIRALRDGGGLRDARLIVLCDVRTRFEDAAREFGPQKGASSSDARRLTSRLHALARRFDRDPRGVPMTGAAGGLSGGLWAAFGAELVPGAAFILDAVGFDARMRASRAVVTGEGRLDLQSLVGKLVCEIATRARQQGVPCHAVVGERQLDSFGARVLDLQSVLEASTKRQLTSAGRRLAKLI
jgi:glycerate kinase